MELECDKSLSFMGGALKLIAFFMVPLGIHLKRLKFNQDHKN
jgi:hypothetical protein